MAEHNKLGTAGEDAATLYLEQKGYRICHRNWHKNHLELDIVAEKDGTLVVVEVKTRSDNFLVAPHLAVDWKKVHRIVVATDAYVKHFMIDLPVRFDILTLVGKAGDFKIEHIEDAFYPPMRYKS